MTNKDDSILKITAVTIQVLTDEAARVHILGEKKVNLLKINKPGTIIWTDPITGERRFTTPGDKLYSTATMYQEAYIDGDGNEVKLEF